MHCIPYIVISSSIPLCGRGSKIWVISTTLNWATLIHQTVQTSPLWLSDVGLQMEQLKRRVGYLSWEPGGYPVPASTKACHRSSHHGCSSVTYWWSPKPSEKVDTASLNVCSYRVIHFNLLLKPVEVLKIFSIKYWIINTSHKHSLKKLKFHLFEGIGVGSNRSN